MLQHIDHMGAAHAGRVVDARVGIAALLQVGHALGAIVEHVFLGAEADRAGRAGLGTGRLQAHADAVGAEAALVGLVVDLAETRHIEGAAGDAVAAADAMLGDEVDDAVRVLHDGARRRAALQAAGVLAVHAAVLADQPFEAVLLDLDLGIAHHRPALRRQVARVVVGAMGFAHVVAQVVPLHAGHLAGLAADAGGHVDELGDLGDALARLRRRGGGGRALGDVKGLK
mmetsp:Transcript_12861/g.24228  ORF Transcript_12861/g.24228 Transcript_12861/m.24228 type:complete len:228 (-) Transcript_12861:1278-1961(-)